MDETIAPDEDRGGSDSGEQDFEDAELDGVVPKSAALADRIEEAENEGRGVGIDFARAYEAEGEQSEDAVKSGLDNLGRGRIKSEDEGLKDEFSIS